MEEFLSNDAGLGYADTKAGETFIRIGVGAVRKPDEKAYRRFATYDIVDPGKRSLAPGQKTGSSSAIRSSAGGIRVRLSQNDSLERTGFTIVHDAEKHRYKAHRHTSL